MNFLVTFRSRLQHLFCKNKISAFLLSFENSWASSSHHLAFIRWIHFIYKCLFNLNFGFNNLKQGLILNSWSEISRLWAWSSFVIVYTGCWLTHMHICDCAKMNQYSVFVHMHFLVKVMRYLVLLTFISKSILFSTHSF